jgi:tRNA threonylcarbamoyladenosine biosynthesis protein TsaB
VSIILNIDTAVQSASVCLAENGNVIGLKINPTQKDHAAWLQIAIKELLEEKKRTFQEVSAIAVSAGPGSYTGLRVGMASAKGLCYALQVPLITINTLQMMAAAGRDLSSSLLCPMIDARRMEVFTAVFDTNLVEILPTSNLILEENSFKDLLEQHTITFFGNGSTKFKGITKSPNARFEEVNATAEHMVFLSFDRYTRSQFADLAYSEPFYGKDFYSPIVKPFG